MKEIDRKQGVQSESAVLVGVELPDRQTGRDNLDELAGLVETAGAEVVGRLTQKRETPDQTTYLGKGKVEQLELMVRATDADAVIFDNNLSPAQMRNLERELGVKVLDRTEVILDIFSTRARTHEARLAVELAQLEYSLPRLKRMWTHLSRIKAGVGMRGPGEKQLETDRRLVERRIVELRGELDRVLRRKEREVAARSDRMTVSLVGYTNAGKSTLLNKLTGVGRAGGRQAVRHARYAHPALAIAELGAGAAVATRSVSSAICRTAWSRASRRRSRKRGRPTCCCTWPTRAIRR